MELSLRPKKSTDSLLHVRRHWHHLVTFCREQRAVIDHCDELLLLLSYSEPRVRYLQLLSPLCLAEIPCRWSNPREHVWQRQCINVEPSGSQPFYYDAPAFSPFSDPKLKARPCERLRIRTNPVIGPFSPSFSMLKFANASSPAQKRQLANTREALFSFTENTLRI
jgi:hypothetical protein